MRDQHAERASIMEGKLHEKKGLSLILATVMLAGILTGCGSSGSGGSAGASADKGTADTAADSGEITK